MKLGIGLGVNLVPPNLGLGHPYNVTLPTVTGDLTHGHVQTAVHGYWMDSPISYAYQWRLDGVSIGGATSATYTPVGGDVGHLLSVRVTASNLVGSESADSIDYGPVL